MTARERRLKWLERKALKKSLRVDPNDSFYIVSDYGYEDCGYEGPFTLDEIFKQWTRLRGTPPDFYDFKNTSGIHYITSDSWRIERLNERKSGWSW